MYKIILIFVLSLIGCACNPKKRPCSQGVPVSLFSNTTPGIKNHSFKLENHNSTEQMRLDSIFPSAVEEDGKILYIPVELSILQTGCEEITQEIRLEFFDEIDPMPKEFRAASCAATVAEIFNKLAQYDLKAIALAELAKAMFNKISVFEYGTPVKLERGFSIQIDKIHSETSTLVTVIFKKA